MDKGRQTIGRGASFNEDGPTLNRDNQHVQSQSSLRKSILMKSDDRLDNNASPPKESRKV